MNFLLFLLAAIIGYFFAKFTSGPTEGVPGKIPSLRFNLGQYTIHLHHWLWGSLVGLLLLITGSGHPFIYGLLAGIITQGLTYWDYFYVIYKKDAAPQKPDPLTFIWQAAFKLSAAIFVFSLAYAWFYYGAISIASLSLAVGATAAFMIGISYAMSGMGYYFDFLDAKVGYRKYFGLAGMLWAIIFCYSLLFVDPERYFYGFFDNLGTAEFILGLLAMAILVFMVIISTPAGIKKIGPANWRLGLRSGYLASALFVVWATLVYGQTWNYWFDARPLSLPPLMLIATIFTMAVILFRGSIFISQIFRRKPVTPPNPTP